MEAPPPMGREMPARPITGQPTFEKDVKEILDCINNDEFGVIGIHGMDGVGKATLMQHVNNHI
ncbi:hypothetical protein AMTR_s00062p00066650 [Amborella trichopoda]|uniref:NB-ARC domain-containing protein n=1 Tax=Amborella trichopoda TaxID=13333 RepID=U5D1R8_AMBTC|nr:hypothetical protein AMTR_s00062p00066650 [Amborella trichopoda]